MPLKNALARVWKHLVDFAKKNVANCLIVMLLLFIAFKPTHVVVKDVQDFMQMPNTNVSQMIPDFDIQAQIPSTEEDVQVQRIPVARTQGTVKKMDYNLARNLVADECIRREPKLSNFYRLSSNDWSSEGLPSIDFVLDSLETNLGVDNLYGNVNTAVYQVFEYLKAQGY
jgi:hypothetical protein